MGFRKSNVLEKDVERPFAAWIKSAQPDYLCIKLFKLAGLPDRLVIGPDRFVLFIEFKRPNAQKKRKGEKLQRYWRDLFQSWGFKYVRCDSKVVAIENFEAEKRVQR